MNYKETLEYLFSRLPMYQRIGAAAYKADLNNTIQMMEILHHPENEFKSIHVAGTNGKGSVCHMLASVFQEAGYKTGLYTSPHLIDFRERIKINGEMIPEEEVVSFVDKYESEFVKIEPSFFEWTVALAFDYFRNQQVDIAIVETGLGGRLDSTNVLKPELSVITNIGLDHTQFLGDTLEAIALEKAGIIKAKTPVIIGDRQIETEKVFQEMAAGQNADIYFSDEFEIDKELRTDLIGEHQLKNLKLSASCFQVLNQLGINISSEHIKKGLSRVISNTELMGRWQILQKEPLVICDVSHNAEGIHVIFNEISKLKFRNLHLIWSMVNDKNLDSVLTMLPGTALYYFTSTSVPRSLEGSVLKKAALEHGLRGESFENPVDAFKKAKEHSKVDDVIFIGGSTFLVGDILKAESNS